MNFNGYLFILTHFYTCFFCSLVVKESTEVHLLKQLVEYHTQNPKFTKFNSPIKLKYATI